MNKGEVEVASDDEWCFLCGMESCRVGDTWKEWWVGAKGRIARTSELCFEFRVKGEGILTLHLSLVRTDDCELT